MTQASPWRNNKGFTFIEVMVAVLIIAISAVGLMQGIAYAKDMLRSVEIEKRALEELQNYLEEYRAVISKYGDDVPTYMAKPNQPEEETLMEGTSNSGYEIIGYIDRNNVERVETGLQGKHKYFYRVSAWIEWDPYPNDAQNQVRRLDAEVSYIQY